MAHLSGLLSLTPAFPLPKDTQLLEGIHSSWYFLNVTQMFSRFYSLNCFLSGITYALDGLQGLTSIVRVDSIDCNPCEADLEIMRNPSLLSLDALESLQEVDGSVSVKQNENVPDIESFEELQTYIKA